MIATKTTSPSAPLPDTLEIEVTRGDIRAGIEGSNAACPIALALRRRFNGTRRWRVGTRDATVLALGDDLVYTIVSIFDLPPRAVDFIARFDQGERPFLGFFGRVRPFTFKATLKARYR